MTAKRRAKVDLLDQALALVERDGWLAYSALALAQASGVGLAEVCTTFGDRSAVIRALGRRADDAMVDMAVDELVELTPRERVFELLMRRFDGLRPARPALARLRRETAPDVWVEALGNLRRATRRVVEAAGLTEPLARGLVLQAALAVLYVQVGRVWLDDESEDQSATLAELDKQLGRIDNLLRTERGARAAVG